ncbi:MAG: hypothetical protein NVSMB64_32050 [Candidatus Velthaea sp.]
MKVKFRIFDPRIPADLYDAVITEKNRRGLALGDVAEEALRLWLKQSREETPPVTQPERTE